MKSELRRYVETVTKIAEYLYAIRRRSDPPTARAAALMAQARRMATQFTYHWNHCVGKAEQGWGDDGYSVDPGDEVSGSSTVNEWKLAMAAELDGRTPASGVAVG